MDGNAGARAADPAERAEKMGEEARRIGHDLNNCLGVISGRAELMQMHLERNNPDGVRKGIDAILGQMARMKELSDSLREMRHRI